MYCILSTMTPWDKKLDVIIMHTNNINNKGCAGTQNVLDLVVTIIHNGILNIVIYEYDAVYDTHRIFALRINNNENT